MPHDPRYIAEDGELIALHVHPRPYQQPHPPVWLLSNAPSTYDFAGSQGYNVIGMASPPGRTRECWSAYSDALAKRKKREVALGEGVAACTQIYVADTMEEAIKTFRPATNFMYEFMNGARPAGEWQRKVYLDEGHELIPPTAIQIGSISSMPRESCGQVQRITLLKKFMRRNWSTGWIT